MGRDKTPCRLSFTGNQGWRLQSINAQTGTFDDMGACQQLARSLKENFVCETEELYTTERCGILTVKASDGSCVKLNPRKDSAEFRTASGKVAATVTDIVVTSEKSILKGKLLLEEALYGTGERSESVNQRGKVLDLYTYDIWDLEDQCYLVIPMLCSSRGSGLFFNRYERMKLDLGATRKTAWYATIENAPVDLYVFTTESISDVLYGYSALSGFASMPKDWMFGMLVCRYSPDFSTKEGVMTMVKKMEEHHLPWTGIIMEGWPTYRQDRWEELKEICQTLHAMGKKVLTYLCMGSVYDTPIPEGKENEYLLTVTGDDGQPLTKLPDVCKWLNNPDYGTAQRRHNYVEVTNPEAVAWFFDGIWGQLANEVGVDGAKIDFCELLPESRPIHFHDKGQPTYGAHHWYPVKFCAEYHRILNAKPDGGMCFTRGGGIGAQRYPFIWAGDQSRQFSRLQWQVNSMLSTGLSGVPFISYDMAGYQYIHGSPTELDGEGRVLARGTEFTAFTICMQTHGKVRRPYDFAEEGDQVTTDIYRVYTKLHEDLFPYIRAYSKIACETGMPVMRHLVLGWQNDRKVYDINDEYLFGDAFLVAPELCGETSRDIYLPAGEWEDLNTGKTYTVGEEGLELKEYAVSMSQIPVFRNLAETSPLVLDAAEAIRNAFAEAKKLKYATEE